MLTYGLIVEGDYDVAVLKELIRKCIGTNIKIVARPCSQRGSLLNKFPGFLEEFRYVKQGTYVDKALVIRDADLRDQYELRQQMESKIVNRNYQFPVKFFVIVQELETWLLADSKAISTVTGRTMSEISEPLEEIKNPKIMLKKILSDAKIPYTAKVARKIASATDIERIEYRCPNFRSFCQIVRDC